MKSEPVASGATARGRAWRAWRTAEGYTVRVLGCALVLDIAWGAERQAAAHEIAGWAANIEARHEREAGNVTERGENRRSSKKRTVRK